jgi:hypothetical protein
MTSVLELLKLPSTTSDAFSALSAVSSSEDAGGAATGAGSASADDDRGARKAARQRDGDTASAAWARRAAASSGPKRVRLNLHDGAYHLTSGSYIRLRNASTGR